MTTIHLIEILGISTILYGIAVGILGTLSTKISNSLDSILKFVKSLFFVTVFVGEGRGLYYSIENYTCNNEITSKKQVFDVAVFSANTVSDNMRIGVNKERIVFNSTELLLLPHAPVFVFNIRGKIVCIRHIQGKAETKDTPKKFGQYEISVLTRDKTWVRNFLTMDILSRGSRPEGYEAPFSPALYLNCKDGWEWCSAMSHRKKDSVFLPEGQLDTLLRRVEMFLNSKEEYKRLGISHKLGICLYGEPGGGKSSLIKLLACHFKKSVHVLNLSCFAVDDEKLQSLIKRVPNDGAIIVIEDIDVALSGIYRGNHGVVEEENSVSPVYKGHTGLTLSGILNFMDGLSSFEDMIVIITTNNIDSLPATLLRRGRIDISIKFTYAEKNQISDMFMHFFPICNREVADTFAESVQPLQVTTAEVQNYLMFYMTSLKDAVDNTNRFLEVVRYD